MGGAQTNCIRGKASRRGHKDRKATPFSVVTNEESFDHHHVVATKVFVLIGTLSCQQDVRESNNAFFSKWTRPIEEGGINCYMVQLFGPCTSCVCLPKCAFAHTPHWIALLGGVFSPPPPFSQIMVLCIHKTAE
jgi:hypothetical protein